jgi:hypothetical protein
MTLNDPNRSVKNLFKKVEKYMSKTTSQWDEVVSGLDKVWTTSVQKTLNETMGTSKVTVKPPKRTMNEAVGDIVTKVSPSPKPVKQDFKKPELYYAENTIKNAKKSWWDIGEYNAISKYNAMIKKEDKSVQDWFYHNIKDPYIIKEAEIRYKNWEDWFILFDKQKKLPYITPVAWGNGIWLHFTKKFKKTLDKVRSDILWKKS